MIISKRRFNEEIDKALRDQDSRRYVFERIDNLERRMYELEAMVKRPVSMERVGLPVEEVKTANF